MFKRIWAEIDRLWAQRDRDEELYSERLQVLKDRCDVLEGRVRAVDYWMREIGAQIGAGVPIEASETEVEGFDVMSETDFENPDLEDTLMGLAWSELTNLRPKDEV